MPTSNPVRNWYSVVVLAASAGLMLWGTLGGPAAAITAGLLGQVWYLYKYSR